jgi:hypothetical protein
MITVVGVFDDQEDQDLTEHPELHSSEVVCYQLGIVLIWPAQFLLSPVMGALFSLMLSPAGGTLKKREHTSWFLCV